MAKRIKKCWKKVMELPKLSEGSFYCLKNGFCCCLGFIGLDYDLLDDYFSDDDNKPEELELRNVYEDSLVLVFWRGEFIGWVDGDMPYAVAVDKWYEMLATIYERGLFIPTERSDVYTASVYDPIDMNELFSSEGD